MPKSILFTAAATLLCLCSCSHARWSAEGTITGAPSKALVVEAPNGLGAWYPLDTVTTDAKGRFKVKGQPLGHPEVFRLSLDGQSLYFPIDSVESVKIDADAAHLPRAKVSGTPTADALQAVNDLIEKVAASKGEAAVGYDPDLKRALCEQILRDPAGLVAYYTIFKRVGQTPVFDPADRSDLRIIGAVANAYHQFRPSDPRTPLLVSMFKASRRQLMGPSVPTDTIAAEVVELPEINLLDLNGRSRSLSEVASHGNVVVLSFTAYGAEASPALNIELAKLYRDAHPRGLEIYQVSLDDDEFLWRQAAKNLPWITVYNSPKDGAQTLLNYNVSNLPAHFVINRQGQLVERVDNPLQLPSSVNRYL